MKNKSWSELKDKKVKVGGGKVGRRTTHKKEDVPRKVDASRYITRGLTDESRSGRQNLKMEVRCKWCGRFRDS